MLPKPPPRETPLGFLYLPPYRVVGTSIAGEATTVLIPELDIAFDMGCCPRPMLTAKYVAVSHGHMDHIGGLAYYCSQRYFQGMTPGNIICSEEIAPGVKAMLDGYQELERQKTPYNIIAIKPEETVEIKPNVVLKGFPLEHRVPTFGFSVIERRSKLKPELVGLPQEKLMELRESGQEITRILEIPLVAYLMDTAACAALVREDVRKAQILITECTFFEPESRDRAKEGLHMHVRDLVEAMRFLECPKIVLGHISRRSHLVEVRKQLIQLIGRPKVDRIELLMDTRTNKERYERQQMDAGEHPKQVGRPVRPGGPSGGSGFPSGGGSRFRPDSGGAVASGAGGPATSSGAGGSGGGGGSAGGGSLAARFRSERPERTPKPRPAGGAGEGGSGGAASAGSSGSTPE